MIPYILLLPLLGAISILIAGKRHKKIRNALYRVFTLLSLMVSVYVFVSVVKSGEMTLSLPNLLGLGLSMKLDGFRALYIVVACFMWAMTALMSERYFAHYHNRTRYYFFSFLTFFGTLGVFCSDDLYTTFVFFEIMSVSSYVWVAHDETQSALKAAETYLAVAILGGMVTLMGMFMMYDKIGSLSFDAIHAHAGESGFALSTVLILFGFIAKAGAVPVQIWLPKAHPVAPAPSSALLSGMLTKTGLFGVLVISFNLYDGNYVYGCILLALALVTMLLGAVLGVFSVNLKRTLACSSMSQMGYILTGIAASVLLGEHGAIPAAGAVTHMVNHSVLKLVLFMSAGVIYMNLHALSLNDIRGFGRKKPFLNIVFLLGSLGLMGVPLFNGYGSKTLIHEGLVEYIHHAHAGFIFTFAEWVFLFAAGLTTAYMLKIYIAIFWQRNADSERQKKFDDMGKTYIDVRSRLALLLAASWVLILGVVPNDTLLYIFHVSEGFLHRHGLHEIAFFNFVNLKGGATTLVIGTLVYLFVVRKWMYKKDEGYIDRWPARLDLENLVYRPVIEKFIPFVLGSAARVMNVLGEKSALAFSAGLGFVSKALDASGEWCARAFMGVVTFLSRLMDELTDHIIVTVREWIMVDREEDVQEEAHDGFLKCVRAFFTGAFRLRKRLQPHLKGDERDVTDLTYGSYFTNAVTFGLILSTIGIVFALIYVLVPTLF